MKRWQKILIISVGVGALIVTVCLVIAVVSWFSLMNEVF